MLIQLHFSQLLRLPLLRLPRTFSEIQDALSALQRLSHIFHAELQKDGIPIIDTAQEYAIIVKDATFEWESSEEVDEQIHSNIISTGVRRGLGRGRTKEENGTKNPEHAEESMLVHRNSPLFRVSNITMAVPRGQLAAIVGPIGSGKVCLTLWVYFLSMKMHDGPAYTVESFAGYYR